jgi:hypothetical protein
VGTTALERTSYYQWSQFMSAEPKRYVVSLDSCPAQFPTHAHSKKFWEALGRVVGTFGFLEEILGKAIFAFTGMRNVPEDQVEEELQKWSATLEKALSDPLGTLIASYCKAVRDYGGTAMANFDQLEANLREAKVIRDVLCHGSWRVPDSNGRSLPFFVNRSKERFQTPVDIAYLSNLQRYVAGLVCGVVNSVTAMGWQFPGSDGPGKRLWTSDNSR